MNDNDTASRLAKLLIQGFVMAGLCAVGYLIGSEAEQDSSSESNIKEATECYVIHPPVTPTSCGVAARDVAQRNIFWRTLNGELVEDSPEKHLAVGLLYVLKDARETRAASDGIDRLTYQFTAYYGIGQRRNQYKKLHSGSFDDKMFVLNDILIAERTATNLLECVLRDSSRMEAFRDGTPIPLETTRR